MSLMDAGRATEPLYVTNLSHQDSRLFSSEELAANYKKLDEYAVQSKLPVLKEGDPDEIRFWVTWANFDVRTIGYNTEGYVISNRGYSVCHIKYPHKQRTPFVGSCKRKTKSAAMNGIWGDVRELAKLSGQSLDCGVLDGEWIEIDGVFAGQRFIIAAGNPDSCEDDGSKLVSKVLGSIR
jgi:hypothetical protein